jgi:hypothetical protein
LSIDLTADVTSIIQDITPDMLLPIEYDLMPKQTPTQVQQDTNAEVKTASGTRPSLNQFLRSSLMTSDTPANQNASANSSRMTSKSKSNRDLLDWREEKKMVRLASLVCMDTSRC